MRCLSVFLCGLLMTDLWLPLSFSENAALAASSKGKKSTKKKSKKRRKPKKKIKNKKKKSAKTAPKEAEPDTLQSERKAGTINQETGRKNSRIDPKEVSRWSNLGAINPIKSEVPVLADLPKRAQPILSPVETPGQKLKGKEGQVSARLSLSAYHVETVDQDLEFVVQPNVNPRLVLLKNLNRDIDLYRVRTDLNYTRIAGSWFSTHLDAEYRGSESINRPQDYRLNALYLAYGLASARKKNEPSYGFQIGRVLVREAGGTQVDGLAARLKLLPGLIVGGFGGFTGNPFRYNWSEQKTEEFSTDWHRFGGFVSWHQRNYYVDVAGVATLLNRNDAGLDRLFFYLNSGASINKFLDLFVNTWFDLLPSGQNVQNLQVVGAYRPTESIYVRLAMERFSTVTYRYSTPQSFVRDPVGAKIQSSEDAEMGKVATATAVDENGEDIRTFDSMYQVATYHAARIRAGYRLKRYWEPFVSFDTIIRSPDETLPDDAVEPLRLLPGLGLSFRNNKIFDLTLRAVGIIDKQTNNKAVLRSRISRTWLGMRASVDGQWFLGGTAALDGGLSLAYLFPRDWFPGRLQIRSSLRYFKEDIRLLQPLDGTRFYSAEDELRIIPVQESYMGFVGLDWKL